MQLRCSLELPQAIAKFEKRIGQRDEEASVGKQSSMASPTEEVSTLLSLSSSLW